MKARMVIVSVVVLVSMGWLATFSPAGAQADRKADRPAEPPERYDVDPVHSTLVFGITHLGVSYFYGRFNSPYGEFQFDPDNLSGSSFEIVASADKVDTNNPRRDGHLKSGDFFNARQFPTITFKSTQVTKAGDNTYKVAGDLTLHGVTKPITIELEHIGTRDTPRGHLCGFRTTFTIKRSDFGMTFMLGDLGDEVTLMIGIEGTKK